MGAEDFQSFSLALIDKHSLAVCLRCRQGFGESAGPKTTDDTKSGIVSTTIASGMLQTGPGYSQCQHSSHVEPRTATESSKREQTDPSRVELPL